MPQKTLEKDRALLSSMNQFFNALYAAGHKSFDLPIERLIVLLRIALTAFCFVIINTSPEARPQYAAPFELILATYALFGIAVALLPTIGRYRTGWQLPVHLLDIGVVSILMALMQTVAFAFFILYVFVLMSATFRWNWRGALWTTLALPTLQLALYSFNNSIADLVLIQWSFILIVGGVFALFGVSRERSTERLSQIADWPNARLESYTNMDAGWLDISLKHVATVLQAPRILVLWEVAQEPYYFSALFVDGKCWQDRTMASNFGPLVSRDLEDVPFATAAIQSGECLTLRGFEQFVGPLVNESIQAQFQVSSVCSAPFSGDLCKGRVFLLDRPHWGNDDLTLAGIVASRLHLELEYNALSVELKETAATRERIRLARDLHDGILQALTGAALQLNAIACGSRQEVRQKLESVRELLLSEQRHIRAFVEGRQASPWNETFNLRDRVQRELENLERQWNCSTNLSITPEDATIPSQLIRELELLLAEAVANAIQHGSASHVNIKVEQTSNNVWLRIADNGGGLPGIAGTYTQNELTTRAIGPRSISKRIAALGGTLSLSSSCSGVELSVELPCNNPALRKINEPL